MDFPTRLYIDGALSEGSGRQDVFNPATEVRVATVHTAGFEDAQRALEAARDAFPRWSATPIAERQAWMRKLREEVVANEDFLRDCVTSGNGKAPGRKPLRTGTALVVSLDFYAEEIARIHDVGLADRAGTHTHRMVHEAAGVVVGVSRLEFPASEPRLQDRTGNGSRTARSLSGSSEKTPISAYAVGQLCERIGLPRGVVQILCTDGYDVADAMTASEDPAGDHVDRLHRDRTTHHADRCDVDQTLFHGTGRQRSRALFSKTRIWSLQRISSAV